MANETKTIMDFAKRALEMLKNQRHLPPEKLEEEKAKKEQHQKIANSLLYSPLEERKN